MIYETYKNFKIVTNIYQIQDILSISCRFFSIAFILYDIKNNNDYINFLTLFQKCNILEN